MEENQPESAAIGGGGLCIDRRCGAVRVRLQQRVTACLFISTVLSVPRALGMPSRHLKVLMFEWRSSNG